MLLALTGCSFKQFYPTMGAVVGGGVGSLGGPSGAALGAGGGALLGEVAQGNAEIEEARETISALTHGDVEALVQKGMEKHATGFEAFTSTIKRILIGAAIVLACYLAIPIFVARQCSKSEVQRGLTNPPFPVRPSQKP